MKPRESSEAVTFGALADPMTWTSSRTEYT